MNKNAHIILLGGHVKKLLKSWTQVHKLIQIIFKINMQLRPEAGIDGLKLEKKVTELCFCVRKLQQYYCLHKNEKILALSTGEGCLVKMMETAEVTKSTSLIREKTRSTFMAGWESLVSFLCETEKNELLIHGFNN